MSSTLEARYLADGTIEFLGRRDQHMNIRGFRIEPGEIETALNLHSGVKECVVSAFLEEANVATADNTSSPNLEIAA